MSVTVTDNFTPQTWGESYPKTWGSANYITWKFGLHDYDMLASGTLTFIELLGKAVSRNEAENLSADEDFAREVVWERTIAELISVMETYWDVIQFHVNVSESFSVSDAIGKNVEKNISVTLQITDKVPKSIIKTVPVTLTVTDTFLRKVKFFRDVSESVSITEFANRHPSTHYAEAFEIYDFFWKLFTGNYGETVSFAEVVTRAFSARRLFEEPIAFNELCKKSSEISKEEAFQVHDTILRVSNAILNNIFINDGEIGTIDDFNDLIEVSPGFSRFINFKVGEYDYEEALVKIIVKSKMEQGQPTISNLTMHVDIPDTDDRGNVVIEDASAATKVYFNKHYYNPPEVNVVLTGGNTGNTLLTPFIVSITEEYFETEIRNSSMQRVTGSISWFAKGY